MKKRNKIKKRMFILRFVFGRHYKAAADVALTFFQGESYSWDEDTLRALENSMLTRAREIFQHVQHEDKLLCNKVLRRKKRLNRYKHGSNI